MERIFPEGASDIGNVNLVLLWICFGFADLGIGRPKGASGANAGSSEKSQQWPIRSAEAICGHLCLMILYRLNRGSIFLDIIDFL